MSGEAKGPWDDVLIVFGKMFVWMTAAYCVGSAIECAGRLGAR